MQEIIQQIHVHVPFALLRDRYLEFMIEKGLQPEISISHAALETFGRDDFKQVAGRLRAAGVPVTFHAPFIDLRPGAVDPEIRRVSVRRIEQVFELVPLFQPRVVVCHPAFDPRYYISQEGAWLENSIRTWRHFEAFARERGTRIALENVYETHPVQLKPLLSALDPSVSCFCFDTGHGNAFSGATMVEWMDELEEFLGHVHLHDNAGRTDEHLPVGDGNFPFPGFFERLRSLPRRPLLTVEAHSERNLWRTVGNLKAMGLLEDWNTDA
ncbi:MAG: sugar phosphate isomerase/epimerase [Syntrophaceae bacterium]|nr:sugar phosphate isomerase/epimerase [Syntrophaceae bacterium]